MAQVTDQLVRLGQRFLGEVLHARTSIGDHGVEAVGRLAGRDNRLVQILHRRLALLGHQPVGVVAERGDAVRRETCVVRRGLNLGDGVPHLRRMLPQLGGCGVDILEDVRNRILVLVAEQLRQPLGQSLDAVDQFRGAVEKRADSARGRGNHRTALRADLFDRGSPALRAGQLDLGHAGEADAVDLRAGALENGGLLIDIHPHPNELRPVGKQRNLGDLPNGNAREADVGALVEAADALREINVVALGGLVREARQPDDEQQGSGKQSHRHRADHDVVRAGLH